MIATASYGGGHEHIAEALASSLRASRPGSVGVVALDLLERAAPRSSALARVAYAAGESFFPDGNGDLARLARGDGGDPVLRELIAGGVASADAALSALRPDAVLAVHPVAAAIASEVSARLGCRVACVLPDLEMGRAWVHPACDLWFVGTPEARDALAAREVAWSAITVSGVPLDVPAPSRDWGARRRDLGLDDRFTALVPDSGRGDAAELAEALAAHGIQVAVTGGSRSRSAGSSLVRRLGSDVSPIDAVHAADLLVCARCGVAQWLAPAAGVPVIVTEPVPSLERASVDLLVTAGVALQARDVEEAAGRAAYLSRHPDRLARMSDDAASLGRPAAARAVAERVLAALG
ncbi:MAG TPA: hypothetical protein VF902_10135 [Coriobacteriia bacterium]